MPGLVLKQTIYSKMQFLSHYHNKQFNPDIVGLVSQFIPKIDLSLDFTNERSFQRLFMFKEDIQISMHSVDNIVHQYTCRICN